MDFADILRGARFDNRFLRELPVDSVVSPERRQVTGASASRIMPTPVAAPRLLAHWPEVAELLGFSPDDCAQPAFAEVFGGNRIAAGMEPYAACYGGHQFGSWAGQLGDGRAITLGELVTVGGERFELQLKGAGPTPYSRTADGRAVLRSSLREFVCSEAMHHLGIPTTRALSLVGTGEPVVRDMFYDGHARPEPGAIVCRVAPSFLRFGSFELPAVRHDHALLTRLADYSIANFFPQLGAPSSEVYVRWFEEVASRTIELITHFMRVGFVHGVLNTDNMSILGLTLDYGPYGFLEDYDPGWTPNTTDAHGRRYCYGRQPQIALFNLGCFGSALLPLVAGAEPLRAVLERSSAQLVERLEAMFYAKLGLTRRAEDAEWVEALPELLRGCEVDMTIFYRALGDLALRSGEGRLPSASLEDPLYAEIRAAFYDPRSAQAEAGARIGEWLARYAVRARSEQRPAAERSASMHAVNPKYVFRNYLAQLAIDGAEAGDTRVLVELMDVLRKPYDEQPGRERFAEKRPDWARDKPGCSMLSCSS